MLQLQQDCDKSLLTQQLRRYSVDYVKITKGDTEWAKRLVDQYLKSEVLQYLSGNSNLPISKHEYTGSLYEKLKTEAADEVDVMVVLQTGKHEVTREDAGVPGFVLLKAEKGSPLEKYVNSEGYIIPEKLRASWFHGLIQRAVNDLNTRIPDSPVELKVSAHGPAVQLDLTEKSSGKKLSADLVPSFQFGPTDYFVAKTYKGKTPPSCDPKLLWRQSFSLREKARLQGMDKEDHGCRHELLRIAKTIIRAEPTFAKLTSYHLKTVFLHYNNTLQNWGPDYLGERFLEYFEKLHAGLADKEIEHFWVSGVNLLDEIQHKTLENMADRLRKILDSEKERSKVLKCQGAPLFNVKETNSSPVTQLDKKQNPPLSPETTCTSDLLRLLREFVCKQGNVLSQETKWSKEVINNYVQGGVLKYCQERSLLISKCEYGGNLYENLKTKGPDEGDAVVLVVLKTIKKDGISIRMKDSDYAALLNSVEGSVVSREFSNPEGLLMPEKVKSWLYKLVTAALQSASANATSDLSFKASCCSAGVKVKVNNGTKALEVLLVPAFQPLSDEYFVPLVHHRMLPEGANPKTAWMKSFTLLEKSLLKDMDQDKGCRHDVLRIVKTVLQREPTFSLLTSSHLKTALLWYNEATHDWSKDSLADRFLGFLMFLQDALQKKAINHFWVKDLNLLSGVPPATLENMQTRLAKIINSEQQRSKILSMEEVK